MSGLVAALMFLFFPRAADACSCITSPVCEALWLDPDASPIVFEATVASQDVRDGQRVVHLADIRDLLGRGAEIVTTSQLGDSCGYDFDTGRRYVIQARTSESGLTVSLCSLTRPLDGAEDLLAYLRSLSRPSPGARVMGLVFASQYDELGSDDHPGTPLAGVQVVAEGPVRREVMSSRDGRFTVDGLPPGTYRLSTTAESRRALSASASAEFLLPNAHACREEGISIQIDGRIEGRVLSRNGAPVTGAGVVLRRVDAHGDLVARTPYDLMQQSLGRSTDAKGRYLYDRLPPGRYVVGVTFVPGVPGLPGGTLYATRGSGAPEVVALRYGQHRTIAPIVVGVR